MQSHPMSWLNPTTDTDGNAYGQPDNAGYVLAIDGQPAVSIPLTFGTSFDIGTLASVQSLKAGPHSASLALVSKDGVTGGFSAPATFSNFATPSAPTNLVVG